MEKIGNDILKTRIKNLKEELEKKKIFEDRGGLVKNKESFSFVVYTLQRFLSNYNVEEILQHVTEGSDDNSIDILHVIENDDNTIDINIFQCKYRDEKNLNKTLGEKDITLFLNSIEQIIINNDISNIKMNEYLKKQYEYLKDLNISIEPKNIRISFYFSTNGADLNDQEKKKIDAFKEKYSVVAEWKVLNNYDFFIGKQRKKNEEPIKIEIDEKVIKMNQDITSYIVTFRTYDLIQLYQKFKDNILEKNIRKLLSGKINKSIRNSLIDEPELFWYKNNGLSIVCRRMEIQRALGKNTLILEEPYIINGGQTTKTIYNLFEERKTEEEREIFYKSYILARIYQTTEEDKISAIVSGTNNQNKITLFDLKSTNTNLTKIKNFFESKGVSLLIKRDCEEKKTDKSINSDTLLQVYVSIYLDIPHKAKNSKNKLIEDFYDDTYNEENIHDKLLIAFQIYEFVINNNKSNKNFSFVSHSLFALLFLISRLNPELKISFNKENLKKVYYEALKILNDIVAQEKKANENYTHNNFFKSEESTNKILKYLEKHKS